MLFQRRAYDLEWGWKNMESVWPSSFRFVSMEDSSGSNSRIEIEDSPSRPLQSVGHSCSIEETVTTDATRERTRPWWGSSGRKEQLLPLGTAPEHAVNVPTNPIHFVEVSSCTWLFVALLWNPASCLDKRKDSSPRPCASVNDWPSDRYCSTEWPCRVRAHQHVDHYSSNGFAWRQIHWWHYGFGWILLLISSFSINRIKM